MNQQEVNLIIQMINIKLKVMDIHHWMKLNRIYPPEVYFDEIFKICDDAMKLLEEKDE